MTRLTVALTLVLVAGGVPAVDGVAAQSPAAMAGRWTLNQPASHVPEDIGFAPDWLTAGGGGPEAGGRGGGSARPAPLVRESAEEAQRLQLLNDELRHPSPHLVILQRPGAVTITDDGGPARTFNADGRKASLELGGISVGVTAKWEADRLVVVYSAAPRRDVRYVYSRSASPDQLVVDVQLVGRGGGGTVRLVYEPSAATETSATPGPAPARAAAPAFPQAAAPAPPQPATPTPARPAPPINQRPDAELKGLTKVGLVVEDLSPQAAACGLTQSALETAVSKRLSAAGFTVLRNSDEDTYFYVNVNTISTAGGSCISRYDASLISNAATTLSYQQTPVLVQVSLLHKGGLSGSAAAAHGEAVVRAVQEYVDQFVMRIRSASQ